MGYYISTSKKKTDEEAKFWIRKLWYEIPLVLVLGYFGASHIHF